MITLSCNRFPNNIIIINENIGVYFLLLLLILKNSIHVTYVQGYIFDNYAKKVRIPYVI